MYMCDKGSDCRYDFICKEERKKERERERNFKLTFPPEILDIL